MQSTMQQTNKETARVSSSMVVNDQHVGKRCTQCSSTHGCSILLVCNTMPTCGACMHMLLLGGDDKA
jgi:hypothetical protein